MMSQEKDFNDDDVKNQPKDHKMLPDPDFSEYKKLVSAEKQSWLEYSKSLKNKYTDLKRDVAKKRKINKGNFNFIDHLPGDEKDFYFQVKRAVNDYKYIQSGTPKLNETLSLMESELDIKRKFLLQLLDNAEAQLE